MGNPRGICGTLMQKRGKEGQQDGANDGGSQGTLGKPCSLLRGRREGADDGEPSTNGKTSI
jgi:hypothetical protein